MSNACVSHTCPTQHDSTFEVYVLPSQSMLHPTSNNIKRHPVTFNRKPSKCTCAQSDVTRENRNHLQSKKRKTKVLKWRNRNKKNYGLRKERKG